MSLNTVFITLKDRSETTGIESLKNKGAAVINYSALLEFLKSNEPQLNIIPVNNDLEGLKKLVTGEFDALASYLPTVPYYIKQTGLSSLRVAGETGFYYNYSLTASCIRFREKVISVYSIFLKTMIFVLMRLHYHLLVFSARFTYYKISDFLQMQEMNI